MSRQSLGVPFRHQERGLVADEGNVDLFPILLNGNLTRKDD
jgi:hypothetical protein